MTSQMDLNGISSLWRKYKKTKDIKIRNKLVGLYLNFVEDNARKIKKKCPNFVELDDLLSVGVFGLIDAIDAFDLSRDIKFEIYCIHRIKGAMLDELRNMDWVPRLVRLRVNKYKTVMEVLNKKNSNSCAPTSQEIADYFGVSIEEAEKIKIASNTPVIRFFRSKNFISFDSILDSKALRPENKISEEDDFNKLISCLTDKEKIVTILYYRDDCTQLEIGKILSLSESRVSRIRLKALKKIKKSLVCKYLSQKITKT